jgi:hypothetical protein
MKRHPNAPRIRTVKAGFGSQTLHIGQTEEQVQSVLGKPESRTRKYKGQYYYNYPGKGIEIDFGKPRGRAKHIFFFRKGVRGNRQARVLTDAGIRPGDTRERVLELLGDPGDRGNPVVLNSGIHFGEWFHYRSGINFQFGQDGRLDMITITSPDRRVGRVAHPLSTSIHQ